MAFKMKGSPMQRNFGVGGSPVNKKGGEHETAHGSKIKIDKKKKVFLGDDVTKQYKEIGNEATKAAILGGAKVYKSKDGKITIKKSAPTEMKSPMKTQSAGLRAHLKREEKHFRKREIKDAQHEAKLRKIGNVGKGVPMKSPAKRTGGIQHFTTKERIH